MSEFDMRRRMMVDTQIRPSDVTKFPIIDAMLAVPREVFVPQAQREAAYADQNITLGPDRVVFEPRTLAKMLDAVNVQGDEMVLDIGAGLGYSSAVVARMAEAVIAVEEDDTLANEAQSILADLGADNVVVHAGDLTAGAAEHGPYDVIILQGGVEEFPQALEEQLKDGGRVACLFMTGTLGEMRLGYKSDGILSWRFSFNAGAPVLPGFKMERKFAL